jgi:hypothetical protein
MTSSLAANPGSWTSQELFLIVLCGSLYLASLVYAIWQGSRRDGQRWYWIACAVSIAGGTAWMIYFALASPADGEMPQRFSAGAWFMLLGLFGSIAGLAVHLFQRIFRQPAA